MMESGSSYVCVALGEDFIIVNEFGISRRYSHISCGKQAVDSMKALCEEETALGEYIREAQPAYQIV